MRKLLYFSMMTWFIMLMGCATNNSQPETTSGDDSSNSALVVIDHGQIQFYNFDTQELVPFTVETDSVVNAVFTEDGYLYYSVAKGQGLVLKRLNADASDPEPEYCADWGLTLEQCVDEHLGGIAALMVSDDGEYLGIYRDFEWENYGFAGLMLYRLADGKVLDAEEMDYSLVHFYGSGELTARWNGSLSDQLDFVSYFGLEDPEELYELDYESISTSPDGRMLLYKAVMPWGDFGCGPFCVSSLDGSMQMILEGSEIHDAAPKWLADGSLVFVGADKMDYAEDAEYMLGKYYKLYLGLMAPDGTIRVISHATAFAVR